MSETGGVLAAFGIGLALASAPGAVQAVLLSQSSRGAALGARALLGSAGTWTLLLLAVALGVSIAAPTGLALRLLLLVGGVYLLWLTLDGYRSAASAQRDAGSDGRMTPALLGALAILLNPGSWLFLGAVAAPLFAAATRLGGTAMAVATALALAMGAAVGDAVVVVAGAAWITRAPGPAQLWFRRGLALLLAALALTLLAAGIRG